MHICKAGSQVISYIELFLVVRNSEDDIVQRDFRCRPQSNNILNINHIPIMILYNIIHISIYLQGFILVLFGMLKHLFPKSKALDHIPFKEVATYPKFLSDIYFFYIWHCCHNLVK